jgi:hypothetical protein
VRRLAILLVAVVAAGALTVTASPPAAALSDCSTRTVGSPPSWRQIFLTVCKGDVIIGDHSYFEKAKLWIGDQSTRATGCTISLWSTLFSGERAWNGPGIIHDCRRTLRANVTHDYGGRGSGTIASAMIAHSCLTLWYNGRKGAPICWDSRLAYV